MICFYPVSVLKARSFTESIIHRIHNFTESIIHRIHNFTESIILIYVESNPFINHLYQFL